MIITAHGENKMKIMVTVKRVVDYEAKIKINQQGNWVETEGVNMIMNPFDEIAVEEALQLKEKHDGEVIVVSVGAKESTQQIRSALAMGADRGYLVSCEDYLDCDATSRVLQQIVEEEKPDIVLMGKQAIDDDNHQIAELLAERLNFPQATQANTVAIEDSHAVVVREADGGLETIKIKMPCVITADLRLNEPRYASLPGIMKAKRKPLVEKSIDDFDVDTNPKVIIKNLQMPASKQAGEIVADVDSLVNKLKNEAKVF